MTENKKHDILLAGQIPAFDVMDVCLKGYSSFDYKDIDGEIFSIMRDSLRSKDYYARIIVLASLALKKMKEDD